MANTIEESVCRATVNERRGVEILENLVRASRFL